jgi:hypothetical protein
MNELEKKFADKFTHKGECPNCGSACKINRKSD